MSATQSLAPEDFDWGRAYDVFMNEESRKQLRFLTVEQAAQELNVSEAAIRSLLRSGELRGFQVGGRGQWRTGAEDLEAYIDGAYRRVAEKISRGELVEVEVGDE